MWQRFLRKFWRGVRLLAVTAVLLLLLVPQWPVFGDAEYQTEAIVGLRRFDFVVWQTNALLEKAQAVLSGSQQFLSEAERKQIVLDYIELVEFKIDIDGYMRYLLTEPEVDNLDVLMMKMQEGQEEARTRIAEKQPLAEAILQEQVATILAEEGFAIAGQVWPPVMVHVSPLPWMLIVSPRDRIERIDQLSLNEGLSVADHEEIETAVFEQLDLSALVVPIGGLSMYPAMIMESSNLNWLAEVIAHEWTHHWMGFHPLGLSYTDPALRTVNETVASIVDLEVGAAVIARYYPERVPPPPPPAAPETSPSPDAAVDEPPAFDFRATMAETRIEADRLLAAGEIEAAEAYMEAQRQVFVANGYAIRKLNQAYFAFYGAYADRPGATGSDPIGPMVREIRALSPSLKAFLQTMAPINSVAEMEAVLADLQAQSE